MKLPNHTQVLFAALLSAAVSTTADAQKLYKWVDAQGNIFLPEVGPIHLEGVPNKKLSKTIQHSITKIFLMNTSNTRDLMSLQRRNHRNQRNSRQSKPLS